jgi:hypothetical protein
VSWSEAAGNTYSCSCDELQDAKDIQVHRMAPARSSNSSCGRFVVGAVTSCLGSLSVVVLNAVGADMI